MKEKHPKIWTPVTNDLKTAALFPQQRTEFISRALLQLLVSIPTIGTALIWPCRNSKMPWKVSCAGIQPNAIHHWLSARLDSSLDGMIGVLRLIKISLKSLDTWALFMVVLASLSRVGVGLVAA
jgi:hypothetical protein